MRRQALARLFLTVAPAAIALAVTAVRAPAYPLNGNETLGIRRLGPDAGSKLLPAGGRLASADVRLHLTDEGRDWDP
ncbi:MAG TPA: hypothetical protein VKU85_13265, partial [bacterium]|nr:hypothetical protein [bacterium]